MDSLICNMATKIPFYFEDSSLIFSLGMRTNQNFEKNIPQPRAISFPEPSWDKAFRLTCAVKPEVQESWHGGPCRPEVLAGRSCRWIRVTRTLETRLNTPQFKLFFFFFCHSCFPFSLTFFCGVVSLCSRWKSFHLTLRIT